MLEDLPTEILQQIIGHLPTASDIRSLSLTSQKIYARVDAENHTSFRAFVQNKFPSIRTPPFWKDVTRVLTSRSRAWDRNAFVARRVQSPRHPTIYRDYSRTQVFSNFGFAPAIDSYEFWKGGKWTNKHDVLAWGAGGMLRMRVTGSGRTLWHTWASPEHLFPEHDILELRLLNPHQTDESGEETVLLRRAGREVLKVVLNPQKNTFTSKTSFITDSKYVDCMDVNRNASPLLAVCNHDSIRMYPVHSEEAATQATAAFKTEQPFLLKHRKRCAKFLADQTLAVSMQFTEGRAESPIQIYHVAPDGYMRSPLTAEMSIYGTAEPDSMRRCANVIAPLDDTSSLIGRAGEVFLTGWNDGNSRLHDIRASTQSVATFTDDCDDGQVLSIVPIGHERFLAGSHQNGCLKAFDLRMPGGRMYSYINATRPANSKHNIAASHPRLTAINGIHNAVENVVQRQINTFLAVHVQPPHRRGQPVSRSRETRLPRYRGPVYSLSSPSPSSPTIFAGIENDVLQLDFVCTDDIMGPRSDSFDFGLGIKQEKPEQILNLSCYERPREGHESSDAILLRKQLDWGGRGWDGVGRPEEGWDERWRLATYDRQSNRGPGWRASLTSQR